MSETIHARIPVKKTDTAVLMEGTVQQEAHILNEQLEKKQTKTKTISVKYQEGQVVIESVMSF